MERREGLTKSELSKRSNEIIRLLTDLARFYNRAISYTADYFRYATAWEPERIDATIAELEAETLHPNAAKRMLARTVVDLYHDAGAGDAAEAEFDRVFKAHEQPSDMPEFTLPGGTTWTALLAETGLAPSKREAGRLIKQGGVKCDGDAVTDADTAAPEGEHVVQVGRRNWARIVVGGSR